jgi:hypothetical protein
MVPRGGTKLVSDTVRRRLRVISESCDLRAIMSSAVRPCVRQSALKCGTGCGTRDGSAYGTRSADGQAGPA